MNSLALAGPANREGGNTPILSDSPHTGAPFTTMSLDELDEVLLSEDFESGLPATWEHVSVQGTEMWAIESEAAHGNLQPSHAYMSSTMNSAAYLATPSIDCSAMQNVILTSDLWYWTGMGFPKIEVSTDGGTVWDLVLDLTSSGNSWDDLGVALNISEFASGESDVVVRFYFEQGGTFGGTFAIDNVSLAADAGAEYDIIGFEDFNDGFPETWTATDEDGDGNTWDVFFAHPSFLGLVESFELEPPYMLFNAEGFPSSGQLGSLFTPIYDCSSYENVSLVVDFYFFKFIDEWAYIDISTDGGNNWIEIYSTNAFEAEYPKTLDLSEYADFASEVQLSFRYDDTGNWGYWYAIDDFMLIGDMSSGDLSGIVTDATTTSPVADADVYMYLDGAEIYATVTGVDGAYEFDMVSPAENYQVRVIADGYAPVAQNNYSIASGSTNVLDFQLVAPTAITVTGTLVSSENPETTIQGATVSINGTALSGVTGADGSFSIAGVDEGIYDFTISFDPFDITYHQNQVKTSLVIATGTMPLSLYALEILAPVNVVATPAASYVTMTWDEPANAVTFNEFDMLFEQYTGMVEYARNSGDLEKFDYYSNLLNRTERYLEACVIANNSLGLDDITDFVGYRVKLDDTILPDVIEERTFDVQNIPDFFNHDYTVAADYGYGDENLVWSEPITTTLIPGYTHSDITYDWVEIRTNNLGTACELTDESVSGGFALSTQFEYYGVFYDSIYVNSNGAITFDYITSLGYRTSPIPQPAWPNNFIVPLWADWAPGDEDGVFDAWFYMDETNNRAVVQWYVPTYGDDPDTVSFEAILNIDDASIVFNYQSANPVDTWPSGAVIGVENAYGSLGLQIPTTVLGDEEAVLLSWSADYGILNGRITECTNTGQGVEDVKIFLDWQFMGLTDQNGDYSFDRVLMGPHSLFFTKVGYYPEMVQDITLIAQQTITNDIVITYPEGSVTSTFISVDVNISPGGDSTATIEIPFDNIGCATLNYSTKRRILITPWEVASFAGTSPQDYFENAEHRTINLGNSDLQTGPVTETGLSLDWIYDPWEGGTTWDVVDGSYGAVVTDTYVITNDWTEPYRYIRYDLEGTLIDSAYFPTDLRGIRDLDWDGTYVYGFKAGAFGGPGHIYRWEPDNIEGFTTVFDNVSALGASIAVDSESGDIYVAGTGWDYGMAVLSPNASESYTETQILDPPVGIMGLGWMPNDINGMNLWCFISDNGGKIVRMNPETGETDEGYPIYPESESFPGGMDISCSYNQANNTIATCMQGMQIDLWEGTESGPRWIWIDEDSQLGTLEAQENTTLTLHVDVTESHLGEVVTIEDGGIGGAEMFIEGYPWLGLGPIDIMVTFNIESSADEASSDLPEEYALHQNYPNPFNPTTAIQFDLVESNKVKLTIYDVLGREVTKLVDNQISAGYHTVNFDGTGLATGVYFYRIEAGTFVDMKKLVLIK
jgi:Carboxypeptidase regulatory-like domain/Secretion system C-terminal sorting domain